MNLLLEVLRDKTASELSRDTIIVCTHAKYSSTQLCQALLKIYQKVIFYPVDYSRNPAILDKLLAQGVTVIEKPEELIPYIVSASCAIEDGARISKLILQHSVVTKKGFYSIEQTSGGVRHFEENPTSYPVINVAFSLVKLHIENNLATPEGILHHYAKATQSLLSGKPILIIGFGSIGAGIARLARTLGARVTVYDCLATKRLFAQTQGYETVEKHQFHYALSKQKAIFMATNNYQGNLLGIQELLLMPEGAVICNAGSGKGEIAHELQVSGTTQVHNATVTIDDSGDHLEVTLKKSGEIKRITILAKGFPINLHLGDGTSHDAIEVVMALMLLAAVEGPKQPTNGLQALDEAIQEKIAALLLRSGSPKQALQPTFVKTNDLSALPVIEKRYGRLYPFHNEISNNANLSVARVVFKPGSKTNGHFHTATQESYYVERGSATIYLRSRIEPTHVSAYKMNSGDYLLVPENYFHDVEVPEFADEDFVALVIATPAFSAWDQFFDTGQG